MGMESADNTPQLDFSLEETKLEDKMYEYRSSGEEKGEEWANKIKEMFEELKNEIIEASKTVDEDRMRFDEAWEKMNDFVAEELKPGI